MCGIWAYVQLHGSGPQRTAHVVEGFWKVSHRGPDTSALLTFDKNRAIAGFHRLSIVDTSHRSNQPFVHRTHTRTIVFMCNGEIYNYKALLQKYKLTEVGGADAPVGDCMTLLLLYKRLTDEMSEHTCTGPDGSAPDSSRDAIYRFSDALKHDVRGEYAFVIMEFDASSERLLRVVAGRDAIGIRPLYYNESALERGGTCLCLCSELKGFMSQCDASVTEMQPGSIKVFTMADIDAVPVAVRHIQFFNAHEQASTNALAWHMDGEYNTQQALSKIRHAVVRAVQERLHAHRPLAFLLSGGVDSSLVCAIAARALRTPIRTFCCGMKGGTDLEFARTAARHMGSVHAEVLFTAEEALRAIPDVVYAAETWDTTTVRASTGQYLISKYIATHTDCRVVLVGEGPDEVCSSYLFNWYCPDACALQEAAVELVTDMHMYDVRRGDRCISRWGMEARVPFLDPDVIRAYWSIPAEMRHPTAKGIEKWWLRAAFSGFDLLPEEVLWRKKEAFSDGVSTKDESWFSIIQAHADTIVGDDEMLPDVAASQYPHCTPPTKEAMWFRKEFCKHFRHNQNCIPAYWQPKYNEHGKRTAEYVDPSARTLDVYSRAQDQTPQA